MKQIPALNNPWVYMLLNKTEQIEEEGKNFMLSSSFKLKNIAALKISIHNPDQCYQ